MIFSEKDLREAIFSNMDILLPSANAFLTLFVLPGNEWAAATSAIILAAIYARSRWSGIKIIWWAVALMLLAGILGKNYIAVASYWLLVSGIISLLYSDLIKR